jgi:hypothetical protein
MLVLSFSPLVSSESGPFSPLTTVLTYPKGEYELGSEFNIEVNVFSEGQYYDPSDVNVTFGVENRELPLIHDASGRYHAPVTINDQDPNPSGLILIVATAIDSVNGYEPAVDGFYIELTKRYQVEIYFEQEDMYPSPGQDFDFDLLCTYGNDYVDPDDENITCWIDTDDDIFEDIALNRISRGRYRGSFTIPMDLVNSTLFELNDYSTLTIGEWSQESDRHYAFKVDFFNIWAHRMRLNDSAMSIELFVYDMENNPIPNAEVLMDYSYSDEYHTLVLKSTSSKTNNDGKASLILNYPEANKTTVYIDGHVEADGYRQSFFDMMGVDTKKNPDGQTDKSSQSWCKRISSGYLSLDSLAEVAFHTSWEGVPLIGLPVYTYIAYEHQILWYGTSVTDDKGQFSIEFETLEDIGNYWAREIFIYNSALINGTWRTSSSRHGPSTFVGWPSNLQLIVDKPDPEISIEAGLFENGGEVRVRMECEGADGEEETAMIQWALGPIDYWLTFSQWNVTPPLQREWAPLTPRDGYYYIPIPCFWSNGAYHGSFTFPDFLPSNTSIFIYGSVMFSDEYPPNIRKRMIVTDLSPIQVDDALKVTIDHPTDDEKTSGTVLVEGTVDGPTDVESVVYSIDDGKWARSVLAEGVRDWSVKIDTRDLANGQHTLYVRCYDGADYSPEESVTFNVKNDDDKKVDQPGFSGAISLIVILLAVTLRNQRKK